MILKGPIRRSVVAVAALAAALLAGVAADAQTVGITINGNAVNVYPAPIVRSGRVFVPLRGVFENLGASVVYDAGLINATGDGHTISLHIGSTETTVDGGPQTIDVAPFIIGASTYVPLRFISQALGASVDYDPDSRIVAISLEAQAPAPPERHHDYIVSQPPPPLPVYELPPPPAPNYLWQPGFWGWGAGGYYWVPGVWVAPPHVGLLWTPPYWGYVGGNYGFHPGYWGPTVGFYGGINYGGGYFGLGFALGHWGPGGFAYNTAVVHNVNTNIIHNTYVDNTTVVNNTTINNYSYNGGPHGTTAKPTPEELKLEHSAHPPLTPIQQEHLKTASQDHNALASVNGGKPTLITAEKPLSTENKPEGFTPLTPEDKEAGKQQLVKPETITPAEHPLSPENKKPLEPEHTIPEHTMPEHKVQPEIEHANPVHTPFHQPYVPHHAAVPPHPHYTPMVIHHPLVHPMEHVTPKPHKTE